MPLDCVATPDFSFHRFASNWTTGSQEGLTTELFSPAPVHRSHPFALTIRPEPATVILRPVVLALPTGRADGRIYRFTKPLEPQHFPWVRRNTHVDRHTRVELALSVWRTDVLPLHQYRIFRAGGRPKVVGASRLSGLSAFRRYICLAEIRPCPGLALRQMPPSLAVVMPIVGYLLCILLGLPCDYIVTQPASMSMVFLDIFIF